MSIISIQNLWFGYDGGTEMIFEDLNLNLDTDHRTGLVGRNGMGKTTLMQLLAGKFKYRGKIVSSVAFEYFPYEIKDLNESVAGVIEEICPAAERWRVEKELGVLGLSGEMLYRVFGTLSGGEKTKVMLAALFLKEDNFLLIDEPTSHLDTEGRKLVAEYLERKRGFILVSHDRAFLDGCVDHILAINRADITLTKGNFSDWQLNKDRRDAFETAENKKLKKDIDRLREASKRNADWSDKVEKSKYGTKNSGLSPDRGYIGHKSAKMMKRSLAIEKRIGAQTAEKAALMKNIDTAEDLKLTVLDYHKQKYVVFKDVSIFYGGKAVCSGINFEVEKGERVLLRGKNGSGKSSILKLVAGEELEFSGEIIRDGSLIVSYLPQKTDHLCGPLMDFAAGAGIDVTKFLTVLRKLDFSREDFLKNLENLSEGEKKKILIANSLCTPCHLLVWDEALNYVDIMSRMQIESLLLDFSPTILFVEHDRIFCEKIAEKIIDIS